MLFSGKFCRIFGTNVVSLNFCGNILVIAKLLYFMYFAVRKLPR